MKKFFFCAICALAILATVGCKGRTYKSQVMLGNEPTKFFHWSWTAQDAPWGICDTAGNEVIPRVYPKSVKYYGDYFIADSITKQVLYSPTGQRLYEAEKIDRSGFKWFVIGTQDGSQYVFDLRTKTKYGAFNKVKVFACGGDVFFLDQLENGTKNIIHNQAVIASNCDEVIAVTNTAKDKKTGFFLARRENYSWVRYNLAGKQTGKLTAKQAAAEKKNKNNGRTVQIL